MLAPPAKRTLCKRPIDALYCSSNGSGLRRDSGPLGLIAERFRQVAPRELLRLQSVGNQRQFNIRPVATDCLALFQRRGTERARPSGSGLIVRSRSHLR